MNSGEYFIVHKKILPDYYEKVVAARELLKNGECREISDAVKRVGISRSTYYKYKDYIFRPSEDDSARKAVISMILHHEAGLLGSVLALLADCGANILTILQSPPIGSRASVVVSMDIENIHVTIPEIIKKLSEAKGVENPQLLDVA